MKIEKRSEGFDGNYSWYIDDKITYLSEPEIIKLVGKEKKNEFFDLWESNKYHSFSIEV